MNIQTLKYFLAVAREESFTRAAEILHITQPALSKQLKLLEDELGKKLFTRQVSGIKLTAEGILLKSRAENLVELSDKIVEEFNSMDDVTGGEIYFGLAESYQIRYLAREIRQLKNSYPNLHCNITSGDTEQVIGKLDKGILDFAVLAETPDFYKYNFLQFPAANVWGLIIPADDELARLEKIQFENLIGLPLFCSGQAWRKEIAEWCGGKIDKLHLEASFKLSYNGSIFVKEGLGYLLTFDKIIDVSEGSGLVFRPLSPKLETKLYLVWKKYPAFSPMAEKFLSRVQEKFFDFNDDRV